MAAESVNHPPTYVLGRRIAGAAGMAAFLTFNLGWILGDHAQPPPFSPARDDISYLGALTASSAWLYNQLAANSSGALLLVLAIGLWRALTPSRLGRLAAATAGAAGVGMFLDGIFRLDCRSIDAGCSNDSWHSHAHKIESGFTAGFTLVSIVLLALAFRRTSYWRASWLPTIAALPAIFIANVAFSSLGAGAATRAGTVVILAVFAFIGFRLFHHSSHERGIDANGGATHALCTSADQAKNAGPDERATVGANATVPVRQSPKK